MWDGMMQVFWSAWSPDTKYCFVSYLGFWGFFVGQKWNPNLFLKIIPIGWCLKYYSILQYLLAIDRRFDIWKHVCCCRGADCQWVRFGQNRGWVHDFPFYDMLYLRHWWCHSACKLYILVVVLCSCCQLSRVSFLGFWESY